MAFNNLRSALGWRNVRELKLGTFNEINWIIIPLANWYFRTSANKALEKDLEAREAIGDTANLDDMGDDDLQILFVRQAKGYQRKKHQV